MALWVPDTRVTEVPDWSILDLFLYRRSSILNRSFSFSTSVGSGGGALAPEDLELERVLPFAIVG